MAKEQLDYMGEYTVDDMGLDSLCYEIRQLAAGKNVKVYIEIIDTNENIIETQKNHDLI